VANQILAIHLTAGRASIAVAESTLRAVRITTLAEVAPGSEQAASIIGNRKWDRVIATLPADAAAFRMLDLPFHDRRRLVQAVGPALEDFVPFSLDESITSFDATATSEGRPVLALMAAAAALDEQRALLAGYGLTAERFLWAPTATLGTYRRAVGDGAAFTAVDVSRDSAVVGCYDEHGLTGLRVVDGADEETLIRNLAWAVRTRDPPSDRIVVGGERVQEIHLGLSETLSGLRFEALPTASPVEMPHHLETAWRSSAVALGLVLAAAGELGRPNIEFRGTTDSQFGAPVELRDAGRSLAPWAALAATTFALAGGLEYARLSEATTQLEKRAEAIYQSAIPSGSGGSGHKLKLELRLSELERLRGESASSRTHAGPLSVLLEMSKHVPRELEVEFDSYVYDAPSVRLSGHGASFEVITRLQQLLEARQHFDSVEVNDVHSAVSGDGVEFEMTIQLGGDA
jgi:hypothetical protein